MPILARATRRGFIAGAALAVAGCGAPPSRPVLTVFAASSLTDVFGALSPGFEAAAGAQASFNFAGTPLLRAQLEQGAQADVFAAAAVDQMELAARAGIVRPASVEVFATNRLIIAAPRENRAGVLVPLDLAKPGLRLVIAQREVPAGAYARESVSKMSADPAYGPGFADRVLRNVVSEEPNVRQALAKALLGEADAVIVYATDADASARRNLHIVEIPAQFNVFARYPAAITSAARSPALAASFIAYLRSPAGTEVLGQFGFGPA